MNFKHLLRRTTWATGFVLSMAASASAAVTFDVNVKAKLNCQSPVKLSGVPLKFDGTMVLNGDGTASGKLKMTTYYLVSFRYAFDGRLGAPPGAVPDVPGAKVQLRVIDKNGLSLFVTFPQNTVTVDAWVSDGSSKCAAEFQPALKSGETQHMIYAGGSYFYCDTFTVNSTRCKVK